MARSSLHSNTPPDRAAATTIHGRQLTLVRTVWMVVVFLILLYGAGSVRFTYYVQKQRFLDDSLILTIAPWRSGLLRELLAIYVAGVPFVVWFGFVVVAIVIFWRKSDDWMALFVSCTLVAVGARLALADNQSAMLAWSPAWRNLDGFLTLLSLGSSLLLFYLFPDGRFVPRWTRLLAAGWVIWTVLAYFFLETLFSWLEWLGYPFFFLPWLGWYATGVFAQIYRYIRVSSPLERQQTKWVLFGLTAPISGFAVVLLIALLDVLLSQSIETWIADLIAVSVISFSMLLVPLGIGIAVLRHRLWDIDPIVNRALVYGTLTALLAAIYFGGVMLLQRLLTPLIGDNDQIVIVASTLAIAALFNPLRRRIQAIIDWRFYRWKYDAQQTIQAFSAKMRDEVDLEQLMTNLIDVVDQTLQPAHVSLWLCSPERTARVGEP